MEYAKHFAAAALALLNVVPAFAQNSLTFQGVTFNTWAVDSDTLGLSILNATHATGNWAGIGYLAAFEINDIVGSGGAIASASITGPGSFFGTVDKGLNAKGCTSGNTDGACFYAKPNALLTDKMTWTIDFQASAGSTLDFTHPHLKVEFSKTLNGGKTGSLLSQRLPVSPIPEPESYAMLLAGLGLMGAIVLRRKGQPD